MESWLSTDVLNLDIALPNDLFHCDHNCNGGGIVVYVKSHLTTSIVHVSPQLNFFYLLSLIIGDVQLVLTPGLHLHLTTWIIYLMKSNLSITPFILILSFYE